MIYWFHGDTPQQVILRGRMQDVAKSFSQTEPGAVESTKRVALIDEWSHNNWPLETLVRNLEAAPLFYFNYHQTYFNTSASTRTHKKLRKKKNIESNKTHAIKWNK